MSNQKRIGRIEDPAKKRRQYLQTIVGARTLGCIGWALIIGFGLPSLLLAGGTVVSIFLIHDSGLVALLLIPTLFSGSMVYLGIQEIRNAN